MNMTSLKPSHDPLLTVERAATQLCIAPGTLRNWISVKRISYVKIGRLTRLTQSALDQYVAAHTVHASEDDE
jgi:excisionase family DNA binding protein